MFEASLYKKYINHTERIQKKLNRMPTKPAKIENIMLADFDISFYQDYPQRFGVKYEGDTLFISKNLSNILEGILAREAFIQFIPKSIDAIPQSYDLAMEYGRQHVTDEKLWLDLWYNASMYLKLEGFFYRPSKQFPVLTRASKGKFLWEFTKKIYKLDDYKLKIPLKEFMHLYSEYRHFFVPTLGEREIQLLNIVLNQKQVDKQDVAQRMGITTQRVSSIIKGLVEKDVIYRRVVINFRKLGFTSYYIYYNGPAEHRDRIQNVFYNNSRYQYALHRFVDGSASFLMILLAPDTPKFFNKLLTKWEREIKNINGTLMCFKRVSGIIPAHTYNFSTYNVKTSSWNIDWFTWFISAKRYLERMNTMPITDTFKVAHDKFDLNQLIPLDLQILDYIIGEGNLNRRKLREHLRKNTNVLQERIKFLESNGVIYNKLFARTIGLTEYISIFINTSNRQLLNVLKLILGMLPYTIVDPVTGTFSRSYSSTETPNGAAILVSTPQGHAIIFERYLKRLLGDYDVWVHVSTSPKYGVWKVPISAWDDEHKKWSID